MTTSLVQEYDDGWSARWQDCVTYGPTRRHVQRKICQLLDGVAFRSVLEIGCGTGVNLANVVTRFAPETVVGCDISPVALERARRAVPAARLLELDIQEAALNEQFDLVLMLDVIEHLPDDAGALRNAARMTRGHLLINTLTGRMRESEKEVGHLRNYVMDDLLRKVAAAGLRPVRVVRWGFPFFSPLHRTIQDWFPPSVNHGEFGAGRKLLSQLLYGLFHLNSSRHGDYVFLLARPAGTAGA